jgi:rod shape-determining protein MreC
MLSLLRRYRVLLNSLLAALLGLYLVTTLAADHARRGPVTELMLESAQPLRKSLYAVGSVIRHLQNEYVALRALWTENQSLRERIAMLESERNRLLEAEITNARLQQLLELKTHILRKSIAAKVISNSASSWFRTLTVDKGRADGLRKGMAAIAPQGVVGKVISVNDDTAKVMLLTDHNSGLDVITQRTRVRGIVAGSMDGNPIIKYIGRNADVHPGDRIITSGLDGIFPKGLLVGTIDDVREDGAGLFQEVRLELAVNPSQIEEVLFVASETRPAISSAEFSGPEEASSQPR